MAYDASAYGAWVGDDWRAWVGVTKTSDTSTQCVLKVESWVWSQYGTTSGYSNIRGAVAYGNNAWQYGSATSISQNSWKKLYEKSFTITKTTSAQTVKCWALAEGISGTYSGDSSTATVDVTVSAKTSYTIAYNANGHGTAPASQTKWYGTALTLRGAISATGYTFKGWNTYAGGGGTAYAAGGSYTANAAATLYAQWQAVTYAVTYNANGGSGAPASQTKAYGTALTLSTTTPTRSGYAFVGWGTSASATTASYQPGATYSANAALSLYAVWQLSYAAPTITNAAVWRCDSGGTAADDGTYAKVTFGWSVDPTDSGEVDTASVRWKQRGTSSWTGSASIAATGSSGSVSEVVGGSFSASTSYDVQVVLTDTHGATATATLVLSPAVFTLDFLAGGTGVAVGKAATRAGLDVAMETYHDNNVIFSNAKEIFGTPTGGTPQQVIGLNANDQLVINYGGYANQNVSTNVDGNEIMLLSRGAINFRVGTAAAVDYAPTAWAYLVGSASGSHVRYCKRAGVVFVEVWYESGAAVGTTAKTLGTLPAGFRPSLQVETCAFGNVNNLAYLRVNPGGGIVAKSMSGTMNYFKGTISFPV